MTNVICFAPKNGVMTHVLAPKPVKSFDYFTKMEYVIHMTTEIDNTEVAETTTPRQRSVEKGLKYCRKLGLIKDYNIIRIDRKNKSEVRWGVSGAHWEATWDITAAEAFLMGVFVSRSGPTAWTR